MRNCTQSYAQSTYKEYDRNVRYLFECKWVLEQHGPKTGRSTMGDEEGYCFTTGLAILYGNKNTEHTADDHTVTGVFSGTLTSQYLYTPLYHGYEK